MMKIKVYHGQNLQLVVGILDTKVSAQKFLKKLHLAFIDKRIKKYFLDCRSIRIVLDCK